MKALLRLSTHLRLWKVLVLLSVVLLFQGCACEGLNDVEESTKSEPSILSEAVSEEDNDGGDNSLVFPEWSNRDIEPLEFKLPDTAPQPSSMVKPKKPHLQKVLSFTPARGATHGHEKFPKRIQGPPQGLGERKGSLDVVSLGCGGSIILEFSQPLIGNGPGPDFIIFENAFSYGGVETFAEPAEVSVSVDGKKWYAFPCRPKDNPWPFPQCAGVKPVYSSSESGIDPKDPDKAGGDAFDLEDLGLPFVRFIKIVDKSMDNPDSASWCGQYNAGFDLDAVTVLWSYQPK